MPKISRCVGNINARKNAVNLIFVSDIRLIFLWKIKKKKKNYE